MNPSQLAINSVSTSGDTLEERLAAYEAAGFRNVEFMLGHVKDYFKLGHTLLEARHLLAAHQIQCIGGFEIALEAFSSPESRVQNHAQIAENARLLAQLGGTCLVVGTDGPSGGVEDPLGELAATFAEVGSAIEDTGVSLCIEFNWSPIVKSLRTAVDVARRSGQKSVGVLFDPAHYHCTPSKFEQLDAEAISYIKHVHVDDMNDKPGELSNCNSDRALPGEGCLDLKALFDRIEQGGYRGYFSIEMFSENLWAMPAHQSAPLMYQSLLPLCAPQKT